MKLTQYCMMATLSFFLAQIPQLAFAATTNCNPQSCQLPVIDCGANGENSSALQNALSIMPKDGNGQFVRPVSLLVDVIGVCKGPFTIAPEFDPRSPFPQLSPKVTIAERFNISAGHQLDANNNKIRPILQGSDQGSIVLQVPLANPLTIVSISGFVVRNGVGGSNGGAITNFGELTLSNNQFENNLARSFAGQNPNTIIEGLGGAIYNARILNVEGSSFTNNRAEGHGAAIYNVGSAKIIGSHFFGNLNNLYGAGGVIHNNSGATFGDNLPLSIIKSGLMDAAPGLSQILNQAGGIYITNSTLSQEGASSGIGISNGGFVRVTYSTIAHKNIGIRNFYSIPNPSDTTKLISGTGSSSFSNSIISQNTQNGVIQNCVGFNFGSDPNSLTDLTSFTIPATPEKPAEVVQTHPCGQGLTTPTRVDPASLKLGPIGRYGGGFGGISLPVIPINPGSVALYAGNPDVCKSASKEFPVSNVDQRGVQRPQDLPLDLGFNDPVQDLFVRGQARSGYCDVGAFELQNNQINFGGLFTRIYGDPSFSIITTTDSNLTQDPNINDVSYSVSPGSSSVCRVDGSTLTILAAGNCVVVGSTSNLNARIVQGAPGAPPTYIPPFFGVRTEQTYKILPADLTVTAPIGEMTYGGVVPENIRLGKPTYNGLKYNDLAPAVLPTCGPTNFSSTTPVSGSPYVTSCTGGSDPNYYINRQPGRLVVNKAKLSITASGGSMIYGGTPNPSSPTGFDPPLVVSPFSFTGFVNGENQSVLSNLTCGLINPTTAMVEPFLLTTRAGKYQTGCKAESGNYEILLPPTSCFADPKIATCSFATVNKASLKIRALSASMVYGDAPPFITPGYVGFRNSDNSLDIPPTCSTAATKLSSVAQSPYVTSCTGAEDNNYSIVYENGTLAVTPAPLTIKASDVEALFGTLPVITPIYTGLKNGQTRTATLPVCEPSYTDPLTPIGDGYTSSCSGDVDSNYVITYLAGAVKINSGLLQIIAPSPTIIFGEPVPVIKPIVVGLGAVNLSNLLPPICSTTATNTSPPGTYPTVCDKAAIENFNISYFNGILTIKKAPTTTVLSTSTGEVGQKGLPFDVLVAVTSTFGSPTGSAVVTARTGETCTAQLTNGVGKCQMTFQTKALQPIKAVYSGDVNFATSTSKDFLFGVVQVEPQDKVVDSGGGCMNSAVKGDASTLLYVMLGLLFWFRRKLLRKA